MKAKPIIWSVLFSLIGPFYMFCSFFIADWIFPGNRTQNFGEDEANRQLKILLMVGVPLFMLLWAWIGNTMARSFRGGGSMILGLLLGTALTFIVARLIPRAIDVSALGMQAVFLFCWASLCGMLALLLKHKRLS